MAVFIILVTLVFGIFFTGFAKSLDRYGRGFWFSTSLLSFSFSLSTALAIIRRAAKILGSKGFFMIQYMQLGANGLQCLHVHIAKALLTDIGTEELAHMEMIAALVYKLVDGATCEDFKDAGWEGQYVQHNHGLFWTDANGVPWCASYIACLGDPIADLIENMAAEQKARVTYEHLIVCTEDPCVKDTLRFLWQREVIHFQRFGEALNDVQEWMCKAKHVWHGHKCGCE